MQIVLLEHPVWKDPRASSLTSGARPSTQATQRQGTMVGWLQQLPRQLLGLQLAKPTADPAAPVPTAICTIQKSLKAYHCQTTSSCRIIREALVP